MSPVLRGLILAVSFLAGSQAIADAWVFDGSTVKSLRQDLNLYNVVRVLSGTDDPTVTAKFAPRGSLYLRSSTAGHSTYQKQDNGTTTNWNVFGIGGTTTGEANTASNLGSGAQLFTSKVGVDLQFRSITQAGSTTVTQNANDVEVSSPAVEYATGTNTGSGVGIFLDKIANILRFKTLAPGASTALSESNSTITISSTNVGEANTTRTQGSGAGLTNGKTGSELLFKSLAPGSNVTFSESNNTLTISSTGGSGGGEANTASNVGAGAGVFKEKSGVDLRLRSLRAGQSTAVSEDGDEIRIETSAPIGERNTIRNRGSGVGLSLDKLGAEHQLATIAASGSTSVSLANSTLTISSTSGATPPGGSNSNIQFNFDGNFAGESNLTWDRTNKRLGINTSAPILTNEVHVSNSSTVWGANGAIGAGVVNDDTTNNNWGIYGFLAKTTTGLLRGAAYISAQFTDHTQGSVNADLVFHTSNNNSLSEKMRIDDDGAVSFNGSYGTTGFVLTSQGSGSPPIWSATGGSGEVNTASNVGTGLGPFKQKVLADLQFYSFTAGQSTAIDQNGNDIRYRTNPAIPPFTTLRNRGSGVGLALPSPVNNALNLATIGSGGSTITLALSNSTATVSLVSSNISHGGLSGLLHDDHTQYALLAGRTGGQTVNGGVGSGESLTLNSTSHGNKGAINLGAVGRLDDTTGEFVLHDETAPVAVGSQNIGFFSENSSAERYGLHLFRTLQNPAGPTGAYQPMAFIYRSFETTNVTRTDDAEGLLIQGAYTSSSTGNLTINSALQKLEILINNTATLAYSALYAFKYTRWIAVGGVFVAGVDEFDIHNTGADRNRYNWTITGTDDSTARTSWTQSFGTNYDLPDATYTVACTGYCSLVNYENELRVVVGIGRVCGTPHLGTKSTTTITGDLTYEVYNTADGTVIGSNGSAGVAMATGAAAFPGATTFIPVGTEYLKTDCILRRRY